jgi:predicted O-methyltransferase YrrM
VGVKAFPSVRTLSTRVRRRGVRGAAVRGLRRAFRIPLVLVASRRLHRRIERVSSTGEALELAYGFSFAGVVFDPWQEPSEIRGLLDLIAGDRPRTILEIGTSNGGSLFLFARVAAPDALLVSVDLPHGEFGGGYPPWRGRLYRSFAAGAQRIELLRANSHDAGTLDAVREALGGRRVDVLFIDGDHSYDGVKRDYEMYSPLVRDGGVIGIHDIVPPSPTGPRPKGDFELQGGEVSQFWTELREGREVSEFVEDWDSGRFGIGAVRVQRSAEGESRQPVASQASGS